MSLFELWLWASYVVAPAELPEIFIGSCKKQWCWICLKLTKYTCSKKKIPEIFEAGLGQRLCCAVVQVFSHEFCEKTLQQQA